MARCFSWICLLACGLALPVTGRAQSFDLSAEMSVSRTSGLAVGDEIVVSITVSNAGPDPDSDVLVEAVQGQQEEYLSDLLGTVSPACGPVEEVETDPPTYGIAWFNVPTIPVGGSITCAARLQIVAQPSDFATVLSGGALSNRDPVPSNNLEQVALTFALPRAPARVPALSMHVELAAAVLTAFGAFVFAGRARRVT